MRIKCNCHRVISAVLWSLGISGAAARCKNKAMGELMKKLAACVGFISHSAVNNNMLKELQELEENLHPISWYRPGSVRLDTWRLNKVNTSLLHSEKDRRRQEEGEQERRRSAELGNTKETLGVPTSLNTFPTTAVAPYWINQRLQSKMYHQTPSLHRNERHRCTSCAGSSNKS